MANLHGMSIINTSAENYTIPPVWCRIRRLVQLFTSSRSVNSCIQIF